MGAAMASSVGSTEVDLGLAFEGPEDPSGLLATLAESLGPMPRVLLRDADAPGADPLVQPASPEVPGPDDRASRLQLFGEIARGGMGAILKGRDVDLGRDLAVKVLLDQHRANPDLVRRFVEEAQIGGQLQHPGVVPIYELGAFADRRPYFAMKLVKGQTLAALLAARPSPAESLPRLLGVFEQVCQTVAYAHARGVIHRDLKPSNVMVGAFGEVQVMDWGLAKVLPRGGVVDDASAGREPGSDTVVATARSGGDSDLSRAGSVMGTPSYMAPEQARGEVAVLDERADVFALGSILCEILTGKPAFTGRSGHDVQRQAARGDTREALARLGACGADAELVALARDCLSVAPEARPRDASALTARLEAYLAGVQERLRDAELERARAEARTVEERKRRKLQLSLAAAVLALTILGGAATLDFQRRSQALAERDARLMTEANLLCRRARERPEDVAGWELARDGLRRIAQDLSDRGPLLPLVEHVQAGLSLATSDRALVAHLVDIRSAQGDDLDGSQTDAAYAFELGRAGLRPDVADPTIVADRIAGRPRAVALALVAALDHWATVRRALDPEDPGWPRMLDAAREADDDPDRGALRDALKLDDPGERLRRLRPLADRADAGAWAPPSLVLLADALADAGDVEAGLAVLRRASGAHPEDAPVQLALGRLLARQVPPDPAEVLRAFAVARSLQPELGAHELAHTLERQGKGVEAEAVWRDLVARRPENARHLGCFGKYLKDRGRGAEADEYLDRAEDAFRKAIRVKPAFPEALTGLGNALQSRGRLDEAVAAFRQAIRLNPDLADAHSGLGIAFTAMGRPDEGAAEHREAIRLNPRMPQAHTNLGSALFALGRYDEAAEAHRQALRLDPKHPEAHTNLAAALAYQGKLVEAAEESRLAVALNRDLPQAHINLGNALACLNQSEASIAAYREAIRLNPDFAEARVNLGFALRRAGDLAGSLDELRMAHALGSTRPDWPYPTAAWVAQAERLADLAGRLPAVLRGDAAPADDAERLALAQVAFDTHRYAGAARLWSEAFEADPALASDPRAAHRYNAACAAARAAEGLDPDLPDPEPPERASLRRRALGWLRAELDSFRTPTSSDPIVRAPPRPRRRASLLHWQTDPDLASVRDPDALAALPEPERAAWLAFWADVASLRDQPAP
jgi:serine/threonine-protein kinase